MVLRAIVHATPADDEQFKEEKAVIIKEISMLDSPGADADEEA